MNTPGRPHPDLVALPPAEGIGMATASQHRDTHLELCPY